MQQITETKGPLQVKFCTIWISVSKYNTRRHTEVQLIEALHYKLEELNGVSEIFH